MMTAEKWHKYQRSYKKYGLDMKPRKAEFVRETGAPVVTAGDKFKMISLLLLIGCLCICLIISTAYVAGVRYEINSLIRGNEELQGDIEHLRVSIKNAANIKTIEERAINELGMVYPSQEQFVFITPAEKPQGDFAMLLMEQAYN